MWLRRHGLCEQEMEAERAWLQMQPEDPWGAAEGVPRRLSPIPRF